MSEEEKGEHGECRVGMGLLSLANVFTLQERRSVGVRKIPQEKVVSSGQSWLSGFVRMKADLWV